MKKGAIITLAIGSTLLVGGAVLFAIGVANSNHNSPLITKEHAVSEFSKINVDIDTADLEFKVSDTYKVVCEEREKQYHTVEVKDNVLNIKSFDDYRWYEKAFNWNWNSMKVTVYAPSKAFDSGIIKASTGDITIPKDYTFNILNVDVSAGDIKANSNVSGDAKFEASTGRISLELNAKNLTVKASTGRIRLKNCLVEEHLDISSSTGDIDVDDCDAKTINVHASTGDVTMVLLSGKTFEVDTSTGSRHYPSSTPGAGLCKVDTSTGDVNITIK